MTIANVSIHLLTTSNSRLMDRVDDDVFDEAIRPELLQAFLANPANVLTVAVADDQVIGMATGFAYVHPDKPLQLFINELGVAERFQRQGIGKELLAALLKRGQELGCEGAWVATGVGNTAARALYRSAGGEEDEQAVVYNYSFEDGLPTTRDDKLTEPERSQSVSGS